jgi:hypothetical protein
MRNLNDTNGASQILLDIVNKTLQEFKNNIIGVEMGIAYGGGVESIGKMWRKEDLIYGFDTFEGHPKQIALSDPDCNYSLDSHAATCMDPWYKQFDSRELTIEYQQQQLDQQRLINVKLIKGLITKDTNIDFIPHIHYCLLDLDFVVCMKDAYDLIKNKLVRGSYLCLHDVIPKGHIEGLYEWYTEIKNCGKYELVGEYPSSFLSVLKTK